MLAFYYRIPRTNNMKVTIKWMKELNASEDDLATFEECIPTGEADQISTQ